MINWLNVEQLISEATQSSFQIRDRHIINGGCINTAFRISDQNRQFFIKANGKHYLDMFAAEAAGLLEIHNSRAIKAPLPLYYGPCGQHSILITEYLNFSQARNDPAFGLQLAAMHQIKNPNFGWTRNNSIGLTPQINTFMDHWTEFYRSHRLQYQFSLAKKNNYSGKLHSLGETLLTHIDVFFQDYQPCASLLHGDLWHGNTATTTQGEPVIYDPACYYGDRETDIAMTELFGGFDTDFYAAYNDAWPLDVGYVIRKDLYNLYHILNHLNLFGGGYENQAINLIQSLISNIK